MAAHLPELKKGDIIHRQFAEWTVAAVDPHGRRAKSKHDEPGYRLTGKIGSIEVTSKRWWRGEELEAAGYTAGRWNGR